MNSWTMEIDQEFMVVGSPKGKKHVPVGSSEPSLTNPRKNETKQLFTSKVSVTFNLGTNAKFNIVRVMKLFEAIKHVDKNAVLILKDDPKFRMHLLGDLPRNETSFKLIFKPENRNRGKQIQIFFLIESDIKVSDMKRDPVMQSFLEQEPKTYFSTHEWSSTNIVSVGMITHKLYDATYRQDYQKKLQNFIAEAINDMDKTEMKDDNASAKTKHMKNIPEPLEIPRIQINPITWSHWNRNEKGKKIGTPTYSTVLNIRCEMHHTDLVSKALYNYSKKMDKYKTHEEHS
jgi:hypothetical protein